MQIFSLGKLKIIKRIMLIKRRYYNKFNINFRILIALLDQSVIMFEIKTSFDLCII